MPYDQRRANGPESTTPYSIYVDLNTKQVKSTVKKELSNRKDLRKHKEIRKMCKLVFNWLNKNLSQSDLMIFALPKIIFLNYQLN